MELASKFRILNRHRDQGLLLLAITMLVATSMHLGRGDGLMGALHAIENGILFIGLRWIGPSRFSFDT